MICPSRNMHRHSQKRELPFPYFHTYLIACQFVKTLWQSDYTKENGIGASNPEKWQALIDESKEIGNIDETFDASELLYTPAK